jgi:hypothetical protein
MWKMLTGGQALETSGISNYPYHIRNVVYYIQEKGGDMKNIFLLCTIALVLAACAGNSSQNPAPTPTISFVDLQTHLEPILYYDGEITNTTRSNWPGGITVGRIPMEYSGFGEPIFVFGKEILNVGYGETGYVLVIKYGSDEELISVFESLDGHSVTTFGEQAISNKAPNDWRQVAFIRCGFLIFIRSYGPLIDEVENYAYQLEGRLMPIICSGQ